MVDFHGQFPLSGVVSRKPPGFALLCASPKGAPDAHIGLHDPVIGMILLVAPARAQTYDPNYRFACKPTALMVAISIAALHRWLSAPRRRPAAPRNA